MAALKNSERKSQGKTVVITAHYSPSYSPQNCGFVKVREKENILPEFGEGEESAVHSFPLKSLFLLYSQVLWEAGAEAGICLSPAFSRSGCNASKN